MKNFLKKNWFKIALCVILVLFVVLRFANKGAQQTNYRTTEAKRGTISVSVTGSGTIAASESRQEISKVSSTVEEIYYLEGDVVKAGWPIAKLDSADYEINIKSQRNAIRQAEISKANLDRQVSNLKIVSNANGYVSNLNLVEGMYVMANTDICTITNSQKDEVTLQFVSSAAGLIQVGNSARVLLTGSLNYLDGTVSFVSDRVSTLATGATVVDVTIEVKNSQFVLTGVNASAEISTGTATFKSVNESPFKSTQAGTIKAETSGSLRKLYVKNGQFVRAGETIAELENSDLVTNAQTTALNLQNLYTQLSYANDKLGDYTIIASIDGTITSQPVKVGDTVGMGSLISTISNKDELEFKIPVDELDIAKLDYDNEVRVTIDALDYTEDNPIKGRISKMPLEGTSVGGVTDYYVTITIPGSSDIRLSMNADAEIIVAEKENVLYVPVESVDKEGGESYVVVVKDGAAEKRPVKTGLKSAAYVEIVEGLEEGEAVVVPEQSSGFGFLMSM